MAEKKTPAIKEEILNGTEITDKDFEQVTGGSALGVEDSDTVILEQSDALLTGAALKVD